MSRPPSAWAMEKAVAQLNEARQRLLEADPTIEDDERLFSDSLEGESGDAFEVLDRFVKASIEADALAKAAKDRIAAIRERCARFERHRDAYRAMVLDAMQTMGLPRLVRPEFTASVRAGSPGVVVTDETALPSQFLRVKTEPDKTAIGAALKAGDVVPGAELKNAAEHLQVRV